MNIGSTLTTLTADYVHKSGNALPHGRVNDLQPQQSESLIRNLAKSIDPTNMTRNDARTIAAALFPNDPGAVFEAQGLVLINDSGQLRPAIETDPIMNEEFNMFDSLKNQIEFNKSKGFSTVSLEKGLEFLKKFKIAQGVGSIDTFI
jgi:Asp-tRNA(Asn)/Glu-tRNA(Gln) amidotransferase B subunit